MTDPAPDLHGLLRTFVEQQTTLLVAHTESVRLQRILVECVLGSATPFPPSAAMLLYGQLLGEVPHDRRVQEGLLLAARGTGDCTQLSQVWQQVRAYLDGETDIELHSMYERLMSETRAVGAAVGGR